MPNSLSSPTVSELFSLAGRTVIIVGGGRGIGLAGVVGCLEAGANVHVFDVLVAPPMEEWSIAREAAGTSGTSLEYTIVDVTDGGGLSEAFSEAFNGASSPVMGLVVTAGISAPIGGLEVTMETWERTHNINVKGSFLCAQIFAQKWMAQNSTSAAEETASIILTSSIFGQGFNNLVPGPAYATSKAAVKHMGRVLGAEWGGRRLRVNTISPGYVSTFLTRGYRAEHPGYEKEMIQRTALKRISEIEEFKAPLVFLLSQASSFITGTDLVIDGGHLAK